jgi:hypothetical protein
MNSKVKTNYYDNLNNSVIKASKKLSHTMDVKMPYDATFTPAEEPEDFDDTFDGIIDLYNNLIVQSQEIYHYLNEKGYYPKLQGSGRGSKPKKLYNRFRLLNAEKTPRFTKYVVDNGVAPLRSRLYGGAFGYSVLTNMNKPDLLKIIQNYNGTVSQQNQIAATGKETNKQLIALIKAAGVNLNNPDIYRPKEKTPAAPPAQQEQAFETYEDSSPEPSESESDEDELSEKSIFDESSGAPSSSASSESVHETPVEDYKFETNPIFGIVNKMFLTMKKLVRYEKYLLKYYTFLNSERVNELADKYKELLKFYKLVFYESDKKLNYKVKQALDDLKVDYQKVIKVLGNILKVNNFDIDVVANQVVPPNETGVENEEVDYGSDSSNDSGSSNYNSNADILYRRWYDNTFGRASREASEIAPAGFAELGPPVEYEMRQNVMPLEDYEQRKGEKEKRFKEEEAKRAAELSDLFDLPAPPKHKPQSNEEEREREELRRLTNKHLKLRGKGMHRETPKSPFHKPSIIERVNKWTFNERPNMTKYLL